MTGAVVVVGVVVGMIAVMAAAAAGYGVGRKRARLSTSDIPDGGWPLAISRDLLLGRIAPGMAHDLCQPLSVISMANENLGYILARLPIEPDVRQKLSTRVDRIATHCDTASQMIRHFRCFGQDGHRDTGGGTIGDALNRSIEASRADIRFSGLDIGCAGDALALPAGKRHGTIEMVLTLLLSAMQHVLAEPPGGGLMVSGRIDMTAAMDGRGLGIDVAFDPAGPGVGDRTGIDAVELWLASRIAADRGGDLKTHQDGRTWFSLRFDEMAVR